MKWFVEKKPADAIGHDRADHEEYTDWGRDAGRMTQPWIEIKKLLEPFFKHRLSPSIIIGEIWIYGVRFLRDQSEW